MPASAEISTVQYSSFRIPMYVLYWVCHVDCKYIQRNYSGINDLRHMRPAHSIFCFSFFGQTDQKWEKSAVLFVYYLYKKFTFCLKMTANFFVFWSKWPKMKKQKMEWTRQWKNCISGLQFLRHWNYIYSTVIPLYIFAV